MFRHLAGLNLRWPIGPAIVVAVALGGSLAHGQSVAIEVNDTASGDDDYLCWTPVKARARLVSPSGNAATQTVRVTSESDAGGGAVQFQEFHGTQPTRDSYAPVPSVVVDLPADGSWRSFWVAGAKASSAAKDTRIVAKALDGAGLGSLAVMVRVRKNADALTASEVNDLFDALRTLHDVDGESANSQFVPYARLHSMANNNEIHKSPLFLPWHRAFVLDLERRLQAINPAVSIPYWKFEQASVALFVPAFMGTTAPNQIFSPGPRFDRWVDPDLGRLVRDPAIAPTSALVRESLADQFDEKYSVFRGMLESQFHQGVHRAVGGWLGSPSSPADPLFFLLHANVDRIWAHWQAKHDRFVAEDEKAYAPQGKYPGVGVDFGFTKGVYLDDAMWPWSASSAGGPAPWPAADHPMPQNSLSGVASIEPTPGSMIDYLDVRGRGLALGYCYDDIDFKGAAKVSP
jgi:tyrosinase